MIRLAHVSDVHVTVLKCRWSRNDWFNKRMAAWLNLRMLGRGRRFQHAESVLKILSQEIREREIDHLVFSGDATALGFEEEVQLARQLFGLNDENPPPGMAVPGNHDYTTHDAMKGAFERHFTPWQAGERIAEMTYPFAQKVGHVWLIGLSSSTPNFWFWDASGEVDQGQLERLKTLIERIGEGPRILVTHYPLCTAKRNLEPRTHRLRNVKQVAEVTSELGISLWLHGHRHAPYQLQENPYTNFPVICCGSSTQTGIWSYGEYTIDGWNLSGLRRKFDPEAKGFQDSETFTLQLTRN